VAHFFTEESYSLHIIAKEAAARAEAPAPFVPAPTVNENGWLSVLFSVSVLGSREDASKASDGSDSCITEIENRYP
jgi:hypothetical protein